MTITPGRRWARVRGGQATGTARGNDARATALGLVAACALLAASGTCAEDDRSVTLAAGSPIQLSFVDTVTSAAATPGQRFRLVVADDVLACGIIVIPRATPALGTVLDSEPHGRMGAGGRLNLKADYLQLGAQRLRVHWTLSSADRSQEKKAGRVNALIVPLGLTVEGKDIVMTAGTRITATTKDDITLPVAPPPTGTDATALTH